MRLGKRIGRRPRRDMTYAELMRRAATYDDLFWRLAENLDSRARMPSDVVIFINQARRNLEQARNRLRSHARCIDPHLHSR